jgi:hypothetical protein
MEKSNVVSSARLVLGLFFIFLLFIFGNIPVAKAEDTQSLEGEWAPTSSDSAWVSLIIVRQDGGYNVTIKYKPNNGPQVMEGFYQGNATQIIASRNLSSQYLASDGFPAPVIKALAGKVTYRFRFTLSNDGRNAEFAADRLSVHYYQNTGEMHDYYIVPFDEKRTLVRVPQSPPPLANTAISPLLTKEILVQQRQKEAHDLNEQGVQYYNNKQWKLAADAFKAAMDKNPDDQTIRRNYEHALQAAATLPSIGKNVRTAPSSGVKGSNIATDQAHTISSTDNCTPWSQKYNRDGKPTGIWGRICVPQKEPTYCEECTASPPGCDLRERGCQPTSCSGHLKCN